MSRINRLSLYPYIVSPTCANPPTESYSITNYGCWIFLSVSSAHAMGCQETKFGDKTLRGERPFMLCNHPLTQLRPETTK